MNPYVVHCKRDYYNVYIGRPSKYGNPFEIGKDGTRDEVIEKFRVYMLKTFTEKEIIEDLKGKILGCWYSPLNCHGDVLSTIANKEE